MQISRTGSNFSSFSLPTCVQTNANGTFQLMLKHMHIPNVLVPSGNTGTKMEAGDQHISLPQYGLNISTHRQLQVSQDAELANT